MNEQSLKPQVIVPFYNTPMYTGENQILAQTIGDSLFSENIEHNIIKNFYETFDDYYRNISQIMIYAKEQKAPKDFFAAASALKDELQEIFANLQIDISLRDKTIDMNGLLEVAEEKIEHWENYSRWVFTQQYGKFFPQPVKEHFQIKEIA